LRWAVGLVLRWAGRTMRVVGCRPRLALHREDIACVIPDALPTSNYNFDTHRSMEQSRVNCREQLRWRSETLCGAKALHVLEHLRHPQRSADSVWCASTRAGAPDCPVCTGQCSVHLRLQIFNGRLRQFWKAICTGH
jgi:hypothetical protein